MTLSFLLCVSVFLFSVATAEIRLKTRTLLPRNEFSSLEKPSVLQVSSNLETHYLLNTHISKVDAVQNTLGKNLSFVDKDVYLVFSSGEKLRTAVDVKWAFQLESQDKIDPEVLQEWEEGVFVATVSCSQNESIQDKANFFQQGLRKMTGVLSSTVTPSSKRKLLVEFHSEPTSVHMFRSVIEWFARQREVLYLEASGKITVFNKFSPTRIQQGLKPGEPFLWKHGLRGEGQIIGCGDTGIDMSSCFFNDPQHQLPINEIDHRHRKVVSYWVDDGSLVGDDREGHGTHVAGVLSGEAFSQNDPAAQSEAQAFNGLAFKSKLAYFDIEGTRQNVKVPDDLYENYFSKFKDSGAHISSHSWGCRMGGSRSCNTYSSQALEADRFMYDNPESLIVFSAGNYALNFGLYSVVSPSTAKNVLTVGATESTASSWYQSCKMPSFSRECRAHASNDGDAVAYFSSRGNTFPSGATKPEIVAPGSPVFSARSNGQSDKFQCNSLICIDEHNKMCPDEAAILPLRGTSMATPYIAAAAALIRQYLVEGYYPSGEQVPSNSFTPTGSLLKAMIVHSGQDVSRAEIDFSYIKLGSGPDRYQGFGAVQLNTVLKIKGENNDLFNLFISDSRSIEHQKVHRYCLIVSRSSVPLRVTLSWSDPAPSVLSNFPMVNNLDLIVFDQSGKVYPLDGRGQMESDASSTVERVTIETPSNGIRHYIYVKGSYVAFGPQKYSLVATGAGLNVEDTCSDGCPNSCSNNGECTTENVCRCNEGFTGVDCSRGNILRDCELLTVTLSPTPIKFSYIVSSLRDNLIIFSTQTAHIHAFRDHSSNPDWIATGKKLVIHGEELSQPNLQFSFHTAEPTVSTLGIFAYSEDPRTISLGETALSCTAPRQLGELTYRHFALSIPDFPQNSGLKITLDPQECDAEGYWSQETSTPDNENSSSNVFNISRSLLIPNVNSDPFYFGVTSRIGGKFSLKVELQTTCFGKKIMEKPIGSISSTTGGAFYPLNSECVWIIEPPTGDILEVVFEEINLVSDSILEVYDKEDGNPVIQVTGTNKPPPFYSQSNFAKLVLKGGSIFSATGFSASYRTLSDDCPENCNGNGVCELGRCKCNEGHYGESCQNPGCSPRCLVNGKCVDNIRCECNDGFWGKNCDNVCPGGPYSVCSGRGSCLQDGKCDCPSPYTGDACEYTQCPSNCNNRGKCLNDIGECLCNDGYWGTECQNECPKNDGKTCTGRGLCSSVTGQCHCFLNAWGNSCEHVECASECVNGECNTRKGICECHRGYWGEVCDQVCPGGLETPCNDQGVCDLESGMCLCEGLSAGEVCNQTVTVFTPSDTKTPVLVTIPASDAVYILFNFTQQSESSRTVQRYLELNKPQMEIQIFTKQNHPPTSSFYDDQYRVNAELEEARIRLNLPPEASRIYAKLSNINSEQMDVYLRITENIGGEGHLVLPVNAVVIFISSVAAAALMCGLLSVCCLFQLPSIEEEDSREEVTVITQLKRLSTMVQDRRKNRRFSLKRSQSKSQEKKELEEIALKVRNTKEVPENSISETSKPKTRVEHSARNNEAMFEVSVEDSTPSNSNSNQSKPPRLSRKPARLDVVREWGRRYEQEHMVSPIGDKRKKKKKKKRSKTPSSSSSSRSSPPSDQDHYTKRK